MLVHASPACLWRGESWAELMVMWGSSIVLQRCSLQSHGMVFSWALSLGFIYLTSGSAAAGSAQACVSSFLRRSVP